MECMMKLIFKKLYVFSTVEKKAKVVEFCEGKNIITSSPIDGTDRGKSVLLKSLYHTLGADCYFDDKWDDEEKAYVVCFAIGDNTYYMYRCSRLFKLFDENYNLIFKTIDRRDLATQLKSIFNFGVELPERDEEKLEITPPAYNYLLYFLDQDYLSGPYFESFRNLGQYPSYKENLLYYHFGAFDEKYYELVRNIEKTKDSISEKENKKQLNENMLDKVFENIKDVSYTKSIDSLREEAERSKEQYSEISTNLSKIKYDLFQLRNDKEDLSLKLKKLESVNKLNEKDITSLLEHKCPYCSSVISDTTELKIEKYNLADDFILLSNDIQIELAKIERKIQKQEELYGEWLNKLNRYEEKLKITSSEISDVLKHKGYIEVRESLLDELAELREQLLKEEASLKSLQKEEKKYNDMKKNINKRYYELMLSDKTRFRLEEIKPKSFEKITKIFSAGGSNKPIATVIWYMNLIKLKNEFNPDAINFPIVFDSPNNAESDVSKKVEVYKYLVDNVDEKNQLIVSGIGYNTKDFENVKFDKVINLDNAKYQVLCEQDYNNNVELLRIMCSK